MTRSNNSSRKNKTTNKAPNHGKKQESFKTSKEEETANKGNLISDTHPSSEAMEVDEKEELTVTKVVPSVRKTDSASGGISSAGSGKKRKGIEEGDKQGGWTVVKGSSFPRVSVDSDNRRDCIRREALLNRSTTPERTNTTIPTYAHKSRCTIKLGISASETPRDAVRNAVQEFFTELCNADSTCTLLPWKNSNFHKKHIGSKSNFPSQLNELNNYMTRFFQGKPNKEFTIYPMIYIGHNKPLQEIRSTMQPWLSSTAQAMYRNMLQVEDTSEIGFFVYSTREMDAGALADSISEIVKVKVGLRWKTINNGRRNVPVSQQVKALIVEVASHERYTAQKQLISFYSRTTRPIQEYPNSIRLRFVKSYQDSINTIEKRKILKLITRQKEFLKTIRKTSNYDIIDLDYQDSSNAEDLNPSLRQMLMSICSVENSNVPLFHSVDLDYMGSGYIFQYSDSVAAEAECVINTMIPYLRYFYEDIMDDFEETYFDPQALARCEGLIYDPKLQCVVDPDSTLDNVEIVADDELEGFNFYNGKDDDLEIAIDDDLSNETRPKINVTKMNNQRGYGPNDDDSVSTFHVPQAAKAVTPTRSTGTSKVGNDNVSLMSSSSTVTMETIQTLREETAQRMTAMSQEINNTMNTKFDQLCALLVNTSPTAATIPQTSQSDVAYSQAGAKGNSSSGEGLQ